MRSIPAQPFIGAIHESPAQMRKCAKELSTNSFQASLPEGGAAHSVTKGVRASNDSQKKVKRLQGNRAVLEMDFSPACGRKGECLEATTKD